MTRPAQPAPSHASLSPDGRHWWDGHEWVPNATEADWKEVAPPPPAATGATAPLPPPAATPAAAYATWRSPYAIPQPASPRPAAQPGGTVVIQVQGLAMGGAAGLAALAGVFGMVAAVLPWISAAAFSISGWDVGDGKYTFVAGLAAVAGGVLLGARSGLGRLLVTLAGLATAGVGIYDLVRVSTTSTPLGDIAPNSPVASLFSFGAGFGLYLTVIAGLVMLIAAWRGNA